MEMEFSEVVSAHFAVPVVGVVVCAVLVFAFGFKSPVQPPSFDLLNEDDHRKYKRSRQQKKHNKTNLDGHMIFIDGHGSPGTKTAGRQQMTINKHVTNEKYDAQTARMKIKKTKQASDFEASSERFGEERDIEVTGEWTMAVSKKDRKNRGKKDEYVKIDESASSAHEVPKATVNHNQAAMNRETNTKAEEVTSNRSYRKNMEVTVTAPAPLPTSEHLTCSVTSTESDCPSVNVNDYTNTAKTTVVRVSVATGSSVTVSQSAEAASSSNAKPLKSDVVPPGTEIQILSDEHVKTSNSSAKASSGAGVQSSAGLPKHCTLDVTVRETKSFQSPKKKKKSPESREKFKESPVVTIPGDAKGASSSTLEAKSIVEPEKSDVKREEIEASPKASRATDSETIYHSIQPQADSSSSNDRSVAKTFSSTSNGVESPVGDSRTAEATSTCDARSSDDHQPSSDNPSPDDSQTSVTADELGDWQQAKPLKKKRRPQKESWD